MFNKNKQENLVIHYFRKDGQYKSWALWIWEFPQGQGKQFDFNGKDSFGVTLTLKLSDFSKNVLANNLGFIIKSHDSWNEKDGGSDRKIKFSKLVKDKNGNFNIYIKEKDSSIYINENFDKADFFEFARFLDYKHLEFKTNDLFKEYKIYENDQVVLSKSCKSPTNFVEVTLKKNIDINNSYHVEIVCGESQKSAKELISITKLYKSEKFSKDFAYNGPLGVELGKEKTTFRVWSPVSKRILVRVYKNGTPTFYDSKKGNDEILFEEEMKKEPNGLFKATIKQNLHGYYYTYVVTNDIYKNKEIIDIYAKSCGINGLRGMIVDLSKTNPFGFDKINVLNINPRHLTIYETHIADLTSSKTWTNDPKNRKFEKTFLGACLEGTTYYENGRTVKTGFDHIKELGVNAVQLLPVFDNANDEAKMTFNWGYNPVNYNIIEGGYSTNPFDGISRIIEFKTLVMKYNKAGINIIMDVVYNHVYGAQGSNFDVLMPGYYFRYNDDETLSNGSGCGNETASEMPMMRKFMIDSTLFLAKEYKLGGFRFDLMGLHDLDTMEMISKSLHELNQNIVIYGEPWCGGCSKLPNEKAAIKSNANSFAGYGYFNDTFRDALVRESCARVYAGWCANSFSDSRRDQENIANAIRGTCLGCCDPNKILNYVTCHDNRTLYDKLMFAGINDEKEIKNIALLANSIVLTSNGMSFILSGEEFLRSKGGCENSYNASYEINELNYSQKIKYIDIFKTYQKLISLKQTVSGLALDKDENINLDVDISNANMIHYEFTDEESNRKYVVYHLNGYKTGKGTLVNLNDYKLYLDTINKNKELSDKTALIPYETLIAYKNL